jgi:hypothetical protein
VPICNELPSSWWSPEIGLHLLLRAHITLIAGCATDLTALGALEPPTLAESRIPTVGCPADDVHDKKRDLVAVGRENLASSTTEAWASDTTILHHYFIS